MKVVFCKISAMKYYKGACDADIPFNGGEYVEKNGKGHEEYNFDPVLLDDDNSYCIGFVETKSNRGNRNQWHIERISGCTLAANEDFVDDVLVVWCATTDRNFISVVGWYEHATVYRRYQECDIDGYIQTYNVISRTENCVLLPYIARDSFCWNVPKSEKGSYGLGQAMIWFANEDGAEVFVKKLISQIKKYSGENNVNKSIDELILNEKSKKIKIN